ncbi:element excision factor XisH family protein [Altericista sp. CCNU0014]|uniref:element excision factor XisH family protein n=1 Tax=Altericista sp. CCNU0014 TaxID=3082949 RepID=UPI00384CA6A7
MAILEFIDASKITDFYTTFCQYLCHKVALGKKELDRTLYLSIPSQGHSTLFQEILIQEVLQQYPVKLLMHKLSTQEI